MAFFSFSDYSFIEGLGAGMGMNDANRNNVIALFDSSADKFPGKPALVSGDFRLTYRELDTLSDRIAARIMALSKGGELLVPLCASRDLGTIVSLLGIMKAGCAYLPIEPDAPEPRVAQILSELSSEIAILDGRGWSSKPEFRNFQTVLTPDLEPGEISSPSLDFPEITSSRLAYVLFTSGSTGKPKGVMIEHGSLLNMIEAFEKIAPGSEPFSGTCLTPFSFDVSIWEIFSVLCYGGALHLLPQGFAVNVPALVRYLSENEISSSYLPPAILPDLIDEYRRRRIPFKIARMLLGVEPIKQKTFQPMKDMNPGISLINGYGPTETTICATFYKFEKMHSPEEKTPIGKPIDGYSVHIVDDDMKACATGVQGEILVGGAGLARGYLNDPELSAKKFVPDVFSGVPGARLYRTGDKAKFLEDGNIEFCGRGDFQVKIRGFRVELGEIESALMRHPKISEVCVTALDAAGGVKTLAAYFKTREGTDESVSEIRRYLSENLPAFMLPSHFKKLDEFPRTQNGKIDRSKLPLPEIDSSGKSASEKPADEMLNTMIEIWEAVLGLGEIAPDDNFFEIGGHSLIAVQLLSKTRDRLGVELEFENIFKNPSPRALANFIREHGGKKLGSMQIHPRASGIMDGLPLSFFQQRIWFIEQFDKDSNAYNIPLEFVIEGDLRPDLLEAAVNMTIARHEILRTSFQSRDGVPFQRIAQSLRVEIPLRDLSGLSEDGRDKEIREHSRANACFRFDLEIIPLLRMELLKLSDQRHLFLLNIHHIISDAWSMELMLKEISSCYKALLQKHEVKLCRPALQYADFCLWQEKMIQGEGIAKDLSYWKNRISGAPDFLPFPSDFPRKSVQTFKGAEIRRRLSADETDRIARLAKSSGSSMNMICFAAFAKTLSIYSGQDDMLVGVPFACRSAPGSADLMGFFINILPVRVNLRSGERTCDFLARIRDELSQDFSHQDLPYEKLLASMKIQRDASYNSLFQVMFNYQNAYHGGLSLDGAKVVQKDFENEVAKLDLTMTVTEAESSLGFAFEYNTELFAHERIAAFAGHCVNVLRILISDFSAETGRICCLGESEKRWLLEGCNSTCEPLPDPALFIGLFRATALAYPEKIAVESDTDGTLTYSQLERVSNRFANFLSAGGFLPGGRVAVFHRRSKMMLASIMGIFKAGGTYIPIDPSHPKERIKHILDDSRPDFIVSRRDMLERLPDIRSKMIFTDMQEDEILSASDAPPQFAPEAGYPAYLIYTSGSTGKPKGVLIIHSALCNALLAFRKILEISEDDRMLAITTISFDISLLDLFVPLISGATLVIGTGDEATDFRILDGKIISAKISAMQATPVTWRLLLLSGWKGRPGFKAFCGGEALPSELARSILSKCSGLWNLYGPTETAIYSSIRKVSQDSLSADFVPIGSPIANTEIYVVDKNIVPLPAGVPGEILIGGAGVSPGYLGRPELNAEKFIDNPFKRNAKVYRTGDLGVRTLSGELRYLSRMDGQVKLRGFRIELGEIETAIASAPGIRQNVVILAEDSGDKMLAAYYVLEPGSDTDSATLIKHLKKLLPEYMIPTCFIKLQALPLTPNGKIDRKSLPPPQSARTDALTPASPPRTETEKMIFEIWRRVLKRSSSGIDEDFFEAGGHSLLAVALMSEIEKATGKRLPISALFRNSTVRSLASLLDGRQEKEAWRSLVPIRAGGRKNPLYIVHGAGLNVLLFNSLVSNMDPDQPIFGLQAKGLDGVSGALQSIPEIASYYISELRAQNPYGPYNIAGYSFGGYVAYEMAKQLIRSGQKVNFVGLFDTIAYMDSHLSPFGRLLRKIRILPRRISYSIFSYLALSKKQKSDFLRRKIEYWKFKISGKLPAKYMGDEILDMENPAGMPPFLQNVYKANYLAQKNYVLEPCKVEIVLFKAARQTFFIDDLENYGWKDFALGGISQSVIPGEHAAIFAPPNDKIFASVLQKALDERNHPSEASSEK